MLDEIEQMWRRHAAVKFPRGCGGAEIAGVCLASVDTFASGCVCTFIAWRGRLDTHRIETLQRCVGELETVVPLLKGEAKTYFELLLDVSRKVLQAVA